MLISLIIPAYNVSSYIEECIHSAFSQTYPHIEVICIDNNSTDDTRQKLEQLKQKYPQLIIDREVKPGTLTTHKPSKMLIVPDSVWPERKINQPYPYNEYYCSSLNYLLF